MFPLDSKGGEKMGYKSSFLLLFLSCSLLVNFGCTTSKAVDERVDAQLKAEPNLPPGQTISSATREVIANSPQITEKQRSELLSIHREMASDVTAIRNQMAKLQVILFKAVLDPDSEAASINNIRRRLLDLDRKRTNRILSALDQAQDVIGPNSLNRKSPDGRPPLIDALEPWKMM